MMLYSTRLASGNYCPLAIQSIRSDSEYQNIIYEADANPGKSKQ